MAVDLKQFKGLTPYAAELFGIYQPLLGWKSKRKRRWIGRAAGRPAARRRSTPRRRWRRRGRCWPPIREPLGPTDLMSHAIDEWADSETGRALQRRPSTSSPQNKRLPEPRLEGDRRAAGFDRSSRDSLAGPRPPPTGAVRTARRAKLALRREAAVAGALQHLADIAPATLHQVLKLDTVAWPLIAAMIDPLASFDPDHATRHPLADRPHQRLPRILLRTRFVPRPVGRPRLGQPWRHARGLRNAHAPHDRGTDD